MSTADVGVFSQSVGAKMSMQTTLGLARISRYDEISSLATQNTTIAGAISPNEPDISGGGTERPFSFAGVLLPGDYTLDAMASPRAFGPIEEGVRSNFSLTFVPEPAVTPWG
jgi:hypothetical protein